MIRRTPTEPAQTKWRRRLRRAVESANLALKAGDRATYLHLRLIALRAASSLQRKS